MLFLADVHLGPLFPKRCFERLLRQLAGLTPDLVLLGGDYAESAALEDHFFERLIDTLQPPMGFYAVPGNNDLECLTPEGFRDCLIRFGVEPLVNRTARLPGGILVAGFDDFKRGSPGGTLFRNAGENELCILLSHTPRLAYTHLSLCERTPDLMLCGHTHGGQFNLFGFTPYSLPCYESAGLGHPMRLVSGLYRVDGVPVLVSNGVGASEFPLRVGVPPQIHMISFRPDGQ